MITDFLIQASFKCQRLEDGQAIANFLAEACPNPKLVAIGIAELIINSIEHGNLAISYQQKDKLQRDKAWLAEIDRRLKLPEYANRFVQIDFIRTSQAITITITDDGNGFDWHQSHAPKQANMQDPHGRGIFIAESLAFQEVRYNEKGNQVTCLIRV